MTKEGKYKILFLKTTLTSEKQITKYVIAKTDKINCHSSKI